MELDATTARCEIFTYREGLLSRVGHDLKLQVARFTLRLDGTEVRATFDADSLVVVNAMRGGVEAPGTLSRRDRRQIDDNLRRSVLHPDRHPTITFEGELHPDDDGFEARGTLTLHGTARAVTVPIRREGAHWCGRARLLQADFDIPVFTALLGTLRIQPHVDVALAVPGDALPRA